MVEIVFQGWVDDDRMNNLSLYFKALCAQYMFGSYHVFILFLNACTAWMWLPNL